MAAGVRSRVRCWCFTMNNPGIFRPEFDEETMNYLVFQMEEGESGTPHLQGYIQMKKQMVLSGMKALWNQGEHWEVSRGTPAEASAYCKKVDSRVDGPWEFGTMSGSGKRNDLSLIATELRTRSLADVFGDHPDEAIRYGKGMRYFRQTVLAEQRGHEWREPKILVYWGDSGAGKSRRARLYDPDLYNVPVHEGGTTWFDGYENQQTILFDDFAGGMKYTQMLRFLDGYSLQVQNKGGFITLNHTMVIITSNKPPEAWYSQSVQGEAEALLRRIYEFGNVIRFRKMCVGDTVEWIDEPYPRQPVPNEVREDYRREYH